MKEQVEQLVAEQLGLDTVQANDHLFNDLGFDDLDVIELVMNIEDKFNISIDDEEATNLRTVQDVVDQVSAKTFSNV